MRRSHVKKQANWEPVFYADYKVKAFALSAYWHLHLKISRSKHYDSIAGRVLKTVVFGLTGEVGKIGK